MKKINVIYVMFAQKTGIQDLYETVDELKENFPNTGKRELKDCELFSKEEDVIGFIKSNGFREDEPEFIHVSDILDDKFEIIE